MAKSAVYGCQSEAAVLRPAGAGVVRRSLAERLAALRDRNDLRTAGSGESLGSRFLRYRFNWYPCYRRTGARLTFLAADLREVRLELPLDWRTRGYWGATFGGSIYGAVDPVLLVMLARNLGPDYMVWDKSATIEFKKPGRSTLYATFRLQGEELTGIKEELERVPRILRQYSVDLADRRGVVHASCVKILHIRRARSSTSARRERARPRRHAAPAWR